jgi:uncharacterized protein
VFVDFLFELRRQGVPVGTSEWLALHDALGLGLITSSESLYSLGRAILVHSEAHFDAYDLGFVAIFGGQEWIELKEQLLEWLENPIPMKEMTPEAFEAMSGMSLEELLKKFEETLAEQKERHDGGNRWVGTGGTSPYGNGGKNPQGIRVGGSGGGRSAVQVAGERRYRDFRTDVTIDVRQFKVALRALRHLAREGREELAIDPTIDVTCKQGGEIELVFEKERKNSIRLVLLMDAGGSMDPYARMVDRLFSAASEIGHWKSFDHYFFHNCPYNRVYTSIQRLDAVATGELLRKHPKNTKVVFVGDACMAPWELTAVGGALSLWDQNSRTGLQWIEAFSEHFDDAIWLNPEPERFWRHETIKAIGREIDMFPLTIDGLRAGIKRLRGGRAARVA